MTKTKELEVKIKDCRTHKEFKTLWNTRKNTNGEDVWLKKKVMELEQIYDAINGIILYY